MSTAAKGASKGKYGILSSRLWFLLGALVVFRIGAHIPVPGIDPKVLADLFKSQTNGILGMFNMFSGGALSRFTIFALGIMPYISSSIIMQLAADCRAAAGAIEEGRREPVAARSPSTPAMARVSGDVSGVWNLGGIADTRAMALVLDPGPMFRLTTVITLVTGTMFLMWLGEQITERGIGNGISLIIFAGIAAGLPRADWQYLGIGQNRCVFHSAGVVRCLLARLL